MPLANWKTVTAAVVVVAGVGAGTWAFISTVRDMRADLTQIKSGMERTQIVAAEAKATATEAQTTAAQAGAAAGQAKTAAKEAAESAHAADRSAVDATVVAEKVKSLFQSSVRK